MIFTHISFYRSQQCKSWCKIVDDLVKAELVGDVQKAAFCLFYGEYRCDGKLDVLGRV